MDCREARRAMSEGDARQAEAHRRECPACAELFKGADLSVALDSSHPEAKLDLGADLQRLRETMDQNAGPLSSLPLLKTEQRAAAALSVGALLLLMVGLSHARADLAVYPRGRLTAEALIVLVPALVLGWALLRPSFARQPSAARSASIVVAGVLAPWLIVALAHVSPHEAHSSAGLGGELWPRAIACFAYGSAFSKGDVP
jgi:hypothetical protein